GDARYDVALLDEGRLAPDGEEREGPGDGGAQDDEPVLDGEPGVGGGAGALAGGLGLDELLLDGLDLAHAREGEARELGLEGGLARLRLLARLLVRAHARLRVERELPRVDAEQDVELPAAGRDLLPEALELEPLDALGVEEPVPLAPGHDPALVERAA